MAMKFIHVSLVSLGGESPLFEKENFMFFVRSL